MSTVNPPGLNAGGSPPSVKSKIASNTSFKQQRLPSVRPTPTAGTALPIFFLIGIIFIPLGIVLYHLSESINEKIIPYTDCVSIENPNVPCFATIAYSTGDGAEQPECTCRIRFNLDVDFKGKVWMYYSLTKFYQNHRRYVISRDRVQLLGSDAKPIQDCHPFHQNENRNVWPCGASANSMFQDEINLFQSSGSKVELIRTGISKKSEKLLYQNPPSWKSDEFRKSHIKPIAWKKSAWELDPTNDGNNGIENEDFIVWMRLAASPNFRKLYRIVNDKTPEFRDGMPKGNYTLEIKYSFPVKSYGGTKSIILTTVSFLGGKNIFLATAFIVVGCVGLLIGTAFVLVHLNIGKRCSSKRRTYPRN